jgi:hypothetical protein
MVTSVNYSFKVRIGELLGKRFDEIQDIGVAANSFDFLFSYFILWLDGTQENVKADGAGIESLNGECKIRRTLPKILFTYWFLGHKGKLLSVLLNVDLIDGFAIKQNLARQRIVESLDQLDTAVPHKH